MTHRSSKMSVFTELRVKFVLFTMVCVCSIIAIAFAAIYAMDHEQRVAEVKQSLDSELMMTIRTAFDNADDKTSGDQPGPRGPNDLRANMLPVAVYYLPYEQNSLLSSSFIDEFLRDSTPLEGTRNTSQELSGQGINIRNAQVLSVMKVSDDLVYQALQQALDAHEEFGELANVQLFYQKLTTPAGVFLAFTDASAVYEANGLPFTLVVAGLGIALVSLLVSYLLSARVLAPVKEAWEGQKRFIANASHELKTPLAVILANNSIVMKHAEDTVVSQSQWLESTQREAQEMQSLIEDMLTMAQLDEAQSADALLGGQQKEQVDLSYELQRIALQFESIGIEQQVTCVQDIHEGIVVNTVKPAIQRIISALLDNAYKYAGTQGWVRVSLEQSGGEAVFTVGNSGQYISEADLPHIFDRFYKADSSHTEKGSFGLGLSIVHGLVQALGGTLQVTSSQTDGTFFTVRLPL